MQYQPIKLIGQRYWTSLKNKQNLFYIKYWCFFFSRCALLFKVTLEVSAVCYLHQKMQKLKNWTHLATLFIFSRARNNLIYFFFLYITCTTLSPVNYITIADIRNVFSLRLCTSLFTGPAAPIPFFFFFCLFLSLKLDSNKSMWSCE